MKIYKTTMKKYVMLQFQHKWRVTMSEYEKNKVIELFNNAPKEIKIRVLMILKESKQRSESLDQQTQRDQ